MSSVGTFKSLCLCGVLAGSCLGQKAAEQKANSAPAPVAEKADIRPAIFQRQTQLGLRGAQAGQIVTAPTVSKAQLSSAGFHLASTEEVDGMEKTLEQYVVAFENLSVPQVKQVWPDLDEKHMKAFKDVFAVFKGAAVPPRLGLQCAIPKVAADTANVECLEIVTYTVGKGKPKAAGPAKVSIELKGQSGHWVVEEMKGTG